MREFIGNPFEQEYDDEDDVIDEIQGFGGEVRLQLENDQLIIVDFINRAPPDDDDDYLEDDTDHASEGSEFMPDVENENTDYDSDYLPENDGYDPDTEFGNDCDVILGEQNLSFSSDDDEDEELDYVTYPIADDKNTAPTTSNSENTES